MSISDEQLTAYHECGHALWGYRLGRRIVSISLNGAFEGNPATFIEGSDVSLGEIQLALAGGVSECVAAALNGGLDSPDRTIGGADYDLDHAQEIAEILYPGRVGQIVKEQLDYLDVEFRKPVTRYAVDALAAKLLDDIDRRLTGDEALRAMGEGTALFKRAERGLWTRLRALLPV